MNKTVLASIALVFTALAPSVPAAALSLQEKLSGRIVLQVEEKGKAWYIDPSTQMRAYLGRPEDAFRVMRELGLGISNKDLEKIAQSDEGAALNPSFAKKLAGKILLQVQSRGEAWYVNPTDLKRYYLGRPADAFQVMRGLGLGVSDKDIGTIPTAEKYTDPEQPAVKASQQPSSAASPSATPSSAVQSSSPTASTPASPSTSKQSTPSANTPSSSQVAGSYRCYSYNVSGGGGGDCRLFAPIVLNGDGTYSVSSEKGTYSVKGDIITLSESRIRGAGKLLGGTQIRFEYDYNGWHHVITYLKESGGASSSATGGTEVSVQLILEYPAKDSALGGIVTVELVPEGSNVKTASYKPTAIAQYDGDKRIIGSFYKSTNMPQTGKKYIVYTNTGFASSAVGTLDLSQTKADTTATIKVSSSGTASAEQKTTTTPEGQEIVVEIDLLYPQTESSLGSIQFVVLVPEGQDPAIAPYKPMALAVWDGDRTVVGSFHKATNQVKTKSKYDVYADWGAFGGMVKSGTLDLSTTTSGPVKKTIQTTISGTSSGASSSNTATSSSTSSTTSSGASSSETKYVAVQLILQYPAQDQSLHNVTRIGFVKQGETYWKGYGNLAGYGTGSQQLTATFSYVEPGFLYDVYTDSYTMGSKKVGDVDMRGVTSDTTKTIPIQ